MREVAILTVLCCVVLCSVVLTVDAVDRHQGREVYSLMAMHVSEERKCEKKGREGRVPRDMI